MQRQCRESHCVQPSSALLHFRYEAITHRRIHSAGKGISGSEQQTCFCLGSMLFSTITSGCTHIRIAFIILPNCPEIPRHGALHSESPPMQAGYWNGWFYCSVMKIDHLSIMTCKSEPTDQPLQAIFWRIACEASSTLQGKGA